MPSRSQLLQERARHSRGALVDAAELLWSDRGVHDVKVEDLCREAGISKGLFYFYFESREALAAELLLQDADRVATAVEEARSSGERGEDLVQAATTALARRAQRRPRAVLAVAVPEYVRSGGAWRASELHVPLADTFSGAIAGVPARSLRPGVDPAEVGLLLADSAMLAVHEWAVADRRQPSLARRLSGRVELVMRGVLR